MKIFKVMADEKPIFCAMCPLQSAEVKIDKEDCGKRIDIANGIIGKVPDERCLVEVKEDENEKKDI